MGRKKPKSLYTIIPYAIPYINTTPLLLHDFVIEKLLCHNSKYIYKTHPPIPHYALYWQNCYIFEDIIDEQKSKSSIFIDSLILILHFYQKNKVLKRILSTKPKVRYLNSNSQCSLTYHTYIHTPKTQNKFTSLQLIHYLHTILLRTITTTISPQHTQQVTNP